MFLTGFRTALTVFLSFNDQIPMPTKIGYAVNMKVIVLLASGHLPQDKALKLLKGRMRIDGHCQHNWETDFRAQKSVGKLKMKSGKIILEKSFNLTVGIKSNHLCLLNYYDAPQEESEYIRISENVRYYAFDSQENVILLLVPDTFDMIFS